MFSELVRAIAKAAPLAPLEEVRDAALILLYRLLFILYAEDRDLLPVNDRRYDDYGLRNKVRGDVDTRKDQERCLLGNRRTVLVHDRRFVPCHRQGGRLYWPATLQRRSISTATARRF